MGESRESQSPRVKWLSVRLEDYRRHTREPSCTAISPDGPQPLHCGSQDRLQLVFSSAEECQETHIPQVLQLLPNLFPDIQVVGVKLLKLVRTLIDIGQSKLSLSQRPQDIQHVERPTSFLVSNVLKRSQAI